MRTEVARLGIGEGPAPKSIQLPSMGQTDIGRVDLTPEQRDIFGDVAGHMAYQVLSQTVNGAGWDTLPDLVKERAYKVAFELSARVGKAAALSDEQMRREIQRISRELSEKLKQ